MTGIAIKREKTEVRTVPRRVLVLDMEVSNMHKMGTVIEDLSITPLDGSDEGFVSFERTNDIGLYQTFEDYANDMVDYILGDGRAETVIAAHNGSAHDFIILLDNLSTAGILQRLSDVRFLDTLPLFRRLCPNLKIDLKSLCVRFGVDSKRAHCAKGDSDALAAILRSDGVGRDVIDSAESLSFSQVRRLMDSYIKMDHQQKQARHHMRYVFGKRVSDQTINKLIENGITVAKIRNMVVSEPKKVFVRWMLGQATSDVMTDTAEVETMWSIFEPEGITERSEKDEGGDRVVDRERTGETDVKIKAEERAEIEGEDGIKVRAEPEVVFESKTSTVKYPFGKKGIYSKRLDDDGWTLERLRRLYDAQTEGEFKRLVLKIFDTRVIQDDRGNTSLGIAFPQKKSKAEQLHAYFRHVDRIKGQTRREDGDVPIPRAPE